MTKDLTLVRLYPTADASIPGVPAEVIDVTEAQAEKLLKYQPPAFTRTKPKGESDDTPPPATEA